MTNTPTKEELEEMGFMKTKDWLFHGLGGVSILRYHDIMYGKNN